MNSINTISNTFIDEYHPFANRRLQVSNLKDNITNEKLIECFSRFGEIIKIERTNNIVSIEFFKIESVVNAIKCLNGRSIDISNVSIHLDFCKPLLSNCILLQSVDRSMSIDELKSQCSLYASYMRFDVDNARNCLIFYQITDTSQQTLTFLKGALFSSPF